MIATHWRLPDAPLRARAATAQLAGIATVLVLAQLARGRWPLGALYALKATTIFGIVVLLSFGFLHRHHPFARFGPANQLTMLRAIAVSLLAGLIGEPRLPAIAAAAAVASVVAASLDGVDGWLARRTRIASAFGARFDMEIDALLILVLSILVWQLEKAGVWVIASGLLRYVFVAAGSVWPWLTRELPRSRRRQTICVLQIAGLAVAIAPWIGPPAAALIAAASLAALAGSFLADTVWLWQRAR
jgi:phosphatidylglycerophosphate synthase